MNDLLKNIDIKKYKDLIIHIVSKYTNKSDTYIEDELLSAGYEGLMDAINRFDIKKGNRFDAYAPYRIEGSILDKLRKIDRHTRNARQWIKK
jgi:RNA polymerase sigma factor for flagellar operon FliA